MGGSKIEISKEKSNFLKLVGATTMLVDHIGAFLFPFCQILRVIGRISFPLFAYQLRVGWQKTSSKENYFKRLFYFGLISQIPFYLLNKNPFYFNILFTFCLGILMFSFLEKKNYLPLFFLFPISLFFDYGLYGLFTLLIFYFFEQPLFQFFLFCLNTIFYCLLFKNFIQIFSLFSFVFIFFLNFQVKIPKYFFYVFYPLHLFLIYLVKITLF
jgi:hypothetical protein